MVTWTKEVCKRGVACSLDLDVIKNVIENETNI